MERKYCGLTWEQMNEVLDTMCNIEDRVEEIGWQEVGEQDAFDIAIQCITTVMNRMKDDRPIEWDDEDT